MNIFQRIGNLFSRSASGGSTGGSTGGVRGFFSNLFKGRTKTPKKDASDFVKQEITDKELLNKRKYDSFNKNNTDMDLTYEEWDTMVTTFGTMGDTIEKFGYEAFKQLMQDLHDENMALSKADMSYVLNESLSIMRASDKPYTQEDAMDLLRERIWLEYGNI